MKLEQQQLQRQRKRAEQTILGLEEEIASMKCNKRKSSTGLDMDDYKAEIVK